MHGNPVPKRDSDHHSAAGITELRSNCYDNSNVARVPRDSAVSEGVVIVCFVVCTHSYLDCTHTEN